MQYSNTAKLSLCALFAALTAVCSWISLPLPFTPVPVNLATLAIFLTGGLLGYKYGPISIIVYVLMGAVGAPVFAGFAGGAGIIAGPTGGYIIGYIAAAFVTGLVINIPIKKIHPFACLAGLLACYTLGTLWFAISTGTGLWASLIMCVFPFLPGDALKIIVATILIKKLKPLIRFKK